MTTGGRFRPFDDDHPDALDGGVVPLLLVVRANHRVRTATVDDREGIIRMHLQLLGLRRSMGGFAPVCVWVWTYVHVSNLMTV